MLESFNHEFPNLRTGGDFCCGVCGHTGPPILKKCLLEKLGNCIFTFFFVSPMKCNTYIKLGICAYKKKAKNRRFVYFMGRSGATGMVRAGVVIFVHVSEKTTETYRNADTRIQSCVRRRC